MLRKFAEENILVFDGGMGTTIQDENIPDSYWGDCYGCNEYLNLSAPEIIKNIHRKYFESGADVVETNTFGATRLVLSEYGLEDQAYNINLNAAKIAKEAAAEFDNKFVFGSIGPGTKLPSLSQISYKDLYTMYSEQSIALLEGGVDGIIIETSQDLLQIKAALNAVFDSINTSKSDLPVCVSVTVEKNGTMLVGSDIPAAAVLIGSYPVYSLGLNCGLGPDMMFNPLKKLVSFWDRKISCIPNAGLPENIGGKSVYSMTPEKMTEIFQEIINEIPVGIVGGCCGTGYEHIRYLKNLTKSTPPKNPAGNISGLSSSLYTASGLTQAPPPAIIGERANANGSKLFRELLLKEDFEGMVGIGKKQEDSGAHFIDACVAYAGRDEKADMTHFVSLLNENLTSPIVIDSTEPEVIENALENYSGKPLINSVNFEDGGKKLRGIFETVKYHPANVIALTIDEEGMAMTSEHKLRIAQRVYDVWTKEYKMDSEGLIIDPLTFSIGSGDETLRYAAVETLDAIEMIKNKLPGVKTVLGVSNVSFGLSKDSRVFLNAVFLEEAVKRGLDLAIVHASKLVNSNTMSKNELRLCKDLIYGSEGSLSEFINAFSDKEVEVDTSMEGNNLSPEDILAERLRKGSKNDIENILDTLLGKYKPFEIINDILMPGMQKIGKLFGEGKMLLPFVLQSAEVMRKSVNYLENFIQKSSYETKGRVVLATVKGDVHDIGKNLVEIILSNNGYEVHNLGIKVPAYEIINKAKEIDADAIGMSGLLVKSTGIMKENIAEIACEELKSVVLLGGAALTEGFVNKECEPSLPGRVFYCTDAFAALNILNSAEQKRYPNVERKKISVKNDNPDSKVSIVNDFSTDDIPEPPFWGPKIVEDIDLKELLPFLNKYTLYKTRWGFKKYNNQSEEDYIKMIKEEADRELGSIVSDPEIINTIKAKLVYGYYKCYRNGNSLVVYTDNYQSLDLDFPRSNKGKQLSIPDYFKSSDSHRFDLLPIQIVTLGEKPVEISEKLKKEHSYKKYFLYHGFFTELTEALAEYWHKKIRVELGIDTEDSPSMDGILNASYRGLRFSFGYPSCPELYGNKVLADILEADRIGVHLSETYQMIPEFTTSAVILHNPAAEYFTI